MLALKTRVQKLSRVAFGPDGRALAAAGQHGAYYWPSVFGDPKPHRLGQRECGGVGFVPGGGQLICALADGWLCVGDAGTGAPRFAPLTGHEPRVAVCPKTGLAVVERWEGGQMAGYRVGPDGAPVQVWSVDPGIGSPGAAAAFAPDGSWFVRPARDRGTSHLRYQLVLHDPATGTEVGDLRGDGWVSAGPAVSPDKAWIAYANGNFLRAQSTADPNRRETAINDNTHQYTGLAFHPSGRFLAATNNDETVKLFDTTTWKVARTFAWKIGKMRSVAFSPDGTLAAAGSDKGRVVVWDVDA